MKILVTIVIAALAFGCTTARHAGDHSVADQGPEHSTPISNQLAGYWRYAEGARSVDVTYREDGTFTGNAAEDGRVLWEYAGKWSLIGDKLNYEFTRSSVKRIPVGKKGQDTLIGVSKDYFIIRTEGGHRHKYIRVK